MGGIGGGEFWLQPERENCGLFGGGTGCGVFLFFPVPHPKIYGGSWGSKRLLTFSFLFLPGELVLLFGSRGILFCVFALGQPVALLVGKKTRFFFQHPPF